MSRLFVRKPSPTQANVIPISLKGFRKRHPFENPYPAQRFALAANEFDLSPETISPDGNLTSGRLFSGEREKKGASQTAFCLLRNGAAGLQTDQIIYVDGGLNGVCKRAEQENKDFVRQARLCLICERKTTRLHCVA